LKQLKELKDTTAFSKINPATKGSDGDFKKGRFGNYGLVYLDNIFIGDGNPCGSEFAEVTIA